MGAMTDVTIAILTAMVWASGYVVGYWMGTLNEKSKEVQRDLDEVRESVAGLERALGLERGE